MKSYPIWNNVQACIYKSSKSYGAREQSCVDVKVGTSSRNSFDFVSHRTTRRVHEDGSAEFRFYVDDQLIKRALVTKKKEYRELPIEDLQITLAS